MRPDAYYVEALGPIGPAFVRLVRYVNSLLSTPAWQLVANLQVLARLHHPSERSKSTYSSGEGCICTAAMQQNWFGAIESSTVQCLTFCCTYLLLHCWTLSLTIMSSRDKLTHELESAKSVLDQLLNERQKVNFQHSQFAADSPSLQCEQQQDVLDFVANTQGIVVDDGRPKDVYQVRKLKSSNTRRTPTLFPITSCWRMLWLKTLHGSIVRRHLSI